MGCASSQLTPEEMTVKLWVLISKRLTDPSTVLTAQGYIHGGAFIDQKGGDQGRYMVEDCREAEKRQRQANRTQEANRIKRIIDMLEQRATKLLTDAVSKGDLTKVQLYVKLGGDVHQSSFGVLGLLAPALKSPNVSLDLVKFLVEAHPNNRAAVAAAVTGQKPAQPLHRENVPQPVQAYLQAVLTQLLLELPGTVPTGQGNDGANATRLADHAELMIQNGANPTLVDAQGHNVLCAAVLAGHVPMVRRLLSLGLDSTYIVPASGQSVLQLAESQSHRDPVLIALLKSHSFNLQFQHRIQQLSEEKEVEFETAHRELQTLLTTGADIHCLDGAHNTPLALLVLALSKHEQEDSGKFIKAFIADFHADPERVNAKGLRPVELAVLYDQHSRLLGELLEAGSALSNSKSGSASLLSFAKGAPDSPWKDAQIHLIQAFLNNKLWETVSRCNRRGKNHSTISNQVRDLIVLGADVNARTGDDQHEGYTPTCLVAQQGDDWLLRQMVEQHKANPRIGAAGSEECVCNTPLHLAAQSGVLGSVHFLRVLSLDLSVRNALGETPLHLAAGQGHLRIVKYLALWGANTELKNSSEQTALAVAEAAAASAPTSPRAAGPPKGDAPLFPLVIAFLQRCFGAECLSEKAHIISQIDPAGIDVCPLVRLALPQHLNPSQPSDEDPLGEKSRGTFKGTPNNQLKDAAKNGNVEEAKKAVSEGADVRHYFDGKSAFDIARATRENLRQRAESILNDYAKARSLRSDAHNCDRVADYLTDVATTKLREAVEQGNEPRVCRYSQVGGRLEGLVGVAAASTPSVGIMHHLVNGSSSNHQALWNSFGSVKDKSPYAIAKAKKHDAVAAYIQQQLSVEIAKAVKDDKLSLVRECVLAGGLPDLADTNNVAIAIEKNNVAMVQFLLDSGARIPAVYQSAQQIEADQSLYFDMRALLRQRFIDRQLRIAAAMGDFATLQAMHSLSADISATNYLGATPLSLSLQFTHVPAVVHYIVSRGGSMLHKQANVPSCVPLSRAPGHPPSNALEQFLKSSLNVALFDSIMNGDLSTAGALGALGAELTSLDEAGNTLVHTAVAFQGVDAVKWLVERGAPLNIANAGGEYAITAATSKGDFGSVEFIVHQNAGTKALKNGQNKSALDIAKELHYNRLVQLMDPGNPDFPIGENDGPQEPSQEPEELRRAALYGQLDVLKIFVEEKYASLARKTQLCAEMIRLAESKGQAEALRLLQPHYKSLTSESASDQTADRLVSASAEQRKILAGFLNSLSGLIAGGEVTLDPSDPATYNQLFSNMFAKQGQQTDFLAKANPQQLTQAAGKEAQELAGKLAKLESEMRAMADNRAAMAKRLAAQEAQLAGCKTALAKKECYKEIQEVKDQLNTLSSSVSLFARAQEAALKKKKTLDALKSQPSLLAAYATIENRLQGMFLACKSATSGMQALNMTEDGDRKMTLVNVAAELSDLIPVVGAALSKVISVGVGGLVGKMDAARQQQEIANITTLGNIEELNKAASNAAALVTFYYSAQINAVDTSPAAKKGDESIPALGEFLVCCMIKSLQKGEVVPGMDLATQLWFACAAQDPLKPQSLVDRLLGTPGDVKVTLKADQQRVTLRALIGSVGVVDTTNTLHVPMQKALQEVAKTKPGFTPFYSVSYIAAFTTQAQVQQIIVRRNLVNADGATSKLYFSSSAKLTEEQTAMLASSVSAFKEQSDEVDLGGAVVPVSPGQVALADASGSAGSQQLGGDITRVSLQVHDALATRGLVVTRQDVTAMLQQHGAEHGVSVESEVEALREEVNTKHNMYQTSIDAATETLQTESEKLRQEHRAVGQELKTTVAKQLADQAAQFAKKQQEQNAAQEAKLAETVAQAQAFVVKLRADSEKQLADMQAANAAALAKLQAEAAAALQAQAAAQADTLAKLLAVSEKAGQDAAAAQATSAQASAAAASTLAAATAAKEQWAADLAASKASFDAALKASSEASAKQVADYKASLEGFKAESKASAASAKETASAAADAAKELKASRELQAKEVKAAAEAHAAQLKLLKEAAEKDSAALLSQAKETKALADKAADAAKSADKAARKAADEAQEAKEKAAKAEASAAKKAAA